MKVKRSSWHYKISHVGSPYEKNRDNLCYYFWRLVCKTIGLLLIIIITPIIFTAGIYAYFTSHFMVSTSIMAIFIFSCMILPAIAIYFIREKIGKSPEIPGENIVFEFIKAKKNKICPLIRYVD